MSLFSVQKFGTNELQLEEGSHVVVATFRGSQTVQGLTDIARGMGEKLSYLKHNDLPAFLLMNLTNVEKMTSEARKSVLQAMGTLPFDQLAIFGGQVYIRTVARFLITISGRVGEIKYFSHEAEARVWLES